MTTEIVEIIGFEQEKATLYAYSSDGRMFVYIESGFLDMDEYNVGKYKISYREDLGQNMVESITRHEGKAVSLKMNGGVQ